MIWTTKQYELSDVVPGMILARPVLSESGKVIIGENNILTVAMIQRLREWDITSLFIKESTVEESDKVLSFVTEHRIFSREHTDIVRKLSKAFEQTRFFKQVPLPEIMELADRSIDVLLGSSGVASHLQALRKNDDYTFRHSVNVGILSGLLGKWLGFKGPKLRELVLAGLLHDIGKTQISPELLAKPGGLSFEEVEMLQEHATLGFELLKKDDKLPKSVLQAVWQHHERMDGSGYPFGLENADISFYARIVAVADVYDAMISDRAYQKAVTPFKIVEEIFADMFNKLDPTACTTFLNNLRDSFIGYIVRLSDGNVARIVYLDKNRFAQPLVKTTEGEYLDLEKRKDLFIVEIISS